MSNIASAILFLSSALGGAALPAPEPSAEPAVHQAAAPRISSERAVDASADPRIVSSKPPVDRVCEVELYRQARHVPRRRAPSAADCNRGVLSPLSVWEQELLRQHRQFHDLNPAWR